MILDWHDAESRVYGQKVTIHKVSDGKQLPDYNGQITLLDTKTGQFVWEGVGRGGSGSYAQPVFVRFESGFMLSDGELPRLPTLNKATGSCDFPKEDQLRIALGELIQTAIQDDGMSFATAIGVLEQMKFILDRVLQNFDDDESEDPADWWKTKGDDET